MCDVNTSDVNTHTHTHTHTHSSPRSLRLPAYSPVGQIASMQRRMYSEKCDGKKPPSGWRLLGGGGGGACVWCTSDDGAHAEFLLDPAEDLPAGKWACDRPVNMTK